MDDLELSAVNAILAGIGEAPVDNLYDTSLDAGMAKGVLDRTSRSLQTKGWWFNHSKNVTVTPEPSNGYVYPLANSLSVLTNEGDLWYRTFTIRERKVYDMQNHTFDLRNVANGGSFQLDFITYLSFEDLPAVFQIAVTEAAKRLFAQDLDVDPNRWRFQREDEDRAMAAVYSEHGRANRVNYLNTRMANIHTKRSFKPF